MAEKNPFADRWLKNQFNERNPGQKGHPDSQGAPAERLQPAPDGPIKYIVWGRVERSGDQFIAYAHAIPRAQARGSAISLQGSFDSEDVAQEALERLKIAAAAEARARGHIVVDAETGGT